MTVMHPVVVVVWDLSIMDVNMTGDLLLIIFMCGLLPVFEYFLLIVLQLILRMLIGLVAAFMQH